MTIMIEKTIDVKKSEVFSAAEKMSWPSAHFVIREVPSRTNIAPHFMRKQMAPPNSKLTNRGKFSRLGMAFGVH